jgi:hypothetical protein
MATSDSIRRAHNFANITGQVFGRLTVLSLAKTKKGYGAYWKCRCECGQEITVLGKCLRRGTTKSCGCRPAGWKHGFHGTRAHACWCNMIERCRNENLPTYRNYGGRGIRVCERWMNFTNFLADMGDPPTAKHSIDRINNDGNYEPGNCRWATQQEQCNNTRQNHYLTFNGRTQTVTQWAMETGLGIERLRTRIKRGWGAERALKTPPQHRRKSKAEG